jgi:PhnB protein
MAKPIPDDQPRLAPYIAVSNAEAAIEFYKKIFGAVETLRIPTAGKVGHAELKIGDAVLMLSDEFPDYGVRSPETIGGSPVSLALYVEDVDATVAEAVGAGAKILRPVEDHFYGDRAGKVEDPFGHSWWISTHKEDVSPEEMRRRAAAESGG